MIPSDGVEIVDCYKCGRDTLAAIGQVHPLCFPCEDDFEDWLRSCF